MGGMKSDQYGSYGKGIKFCRLMHHPYKLFIQYYPIESGNWKSMRHYYRQKIKKGELKMPPSPEQYQEDGGNFEDILKLHGLTPELAQQFTEQGFHVGYIKNSDGEIEYTIPLPNAKRKGADITQFEPATPARITPSRRKAPQRDYRALYVFSDAQIDYRRMEDGELIPIHDERALAVGRMICRDVMPDEIINLGDTVDLARLSRFKADSDHFSRTLAPSFQRVHDYYAELRADNPWAKIVEVDSNHNTRLKDFFMKQAPELYGFRRAGTDDEYPMFTYPYMANLGEVGVEWVSGYGAAEYEYGLEYDTPSIIFKHGKSNVSNGSTAAKESKENPYNHIVRGHSHRIETHHRTTRDGNYLGSFIVGASCRITGEVPSYHSAVDDRGEVVKYQEDWQQGVMVIYDYEGEYQFDQIPIKDGRANYNGRLYDGNS